MKRYQKEDKKPSSPGEASDPEGTPMTLLNSALLFPVLFFALGCWLETKGIGKQGNADRFFTRWPLAGFGALVGAIMLA